MKATHNINFEGLDLVVTGEYDKPDGTTGYKGGFSWDSIYINDVEWSWFISKDAINRIVDLVIEENYQT